MGAVRVGAGRDNHLYARVAGVIAPQSRRKPDKKRERRPRHDRNMSNARAASASSGSHA